MPTSSQTSDISDLEPRLRQLARRVVAARRGYVLPPAATSGVVWEPLDGPQREAYYSEADELAYGGAAGGGKTDLLLGLCFTAHHRSIIFRREYPQLKGIITRSKEIVGNSRLFNGSDLIWRLSGGREVEFGAVQHEDDREKYQGRPHDLKAFDELPHFTRLQYRYLTAWNRTTIPGQRCRVVATFNPPTPGQGDWVMEEWAPWLDEGFANPAEPGELRWYAILGGELNWVDSPEPIEHEGELVQPRSRTFIRARVTDNPYLMRTGYVATLQALPEPLRSQLLRGDFNVGIDDDPWQVIPTEWVRQAQARWERTPKPDLPLTSLGVDPARGGKDKTVLARRYAAWFAPLEKHAGTSTPDGPAVAALVMAALGSERAEVNIDSIGIGASPLDILKGNGVDVNAINFAASTDLTDKSGKYRLRNLRAAAYWKLREALDPASGENVCIPPDRELLADLVAARWTLQMSGITVEPKDDIAERLGRSPDCGDAVALCFSPTPPAWEFYSS